MSLVEAKVGSTYRVTQMQVEEKIMRRLEALGILEGTRIEILNRKRNGATIIKVRGARWALGNDIAGGISVEDDAA
jgi:ferrous iron transport protein A